MAEDNGSESDDNPFSFTTFVKRGSQNVDQMIASKLNAERNNLKNRLSYQETSSTDCLFTFDDDADSESDKDNPFSFKEFLKREDKRDEDKDDEEIIDIFEQGEDMGNQNGTAAQPAPSSDGRPTQRRATSPGLPSRHKNKATSKSPASAAAVSSAASNTNSAQSSPGNHKRSNQGSDFVDFIYDYATQNGETEAGKDQNGSGNLGSSVDSGMPPIPEKKNHGRERARAHTHGHAIRKQKNGHSKPHPKSQVVLDYIDATNESQGYGATAGATVTIGKDVDGVLGEAPRPKASSDVKPHRERARAHSHGQRKHKSGDVKHSKNKTNGEIPSEKETKQVLTIENGIYGSTRDNRIEKNEMKSESPKESDYGDALLKPNGPSKSQSVPDILNEPSEALLERSETPEKPIPKVSPNITPTNTPPRSDVALLDPEILKLRQENSRLRKELADARKQIDKDFKKIDTMEEELKKLRVREAEDAKTLETMVHHVEENLKRTTERAVTAESTITKLKQEVKSLKSEISTSNAEKVKYKEGKEYTQMCEKAHKTSVKLANAAKDAEKNLKHLMSGVDVLKVLAESLACIERMTDETPQTGNGKGFGTAL